jgi:spartin
MFTTSDAHILVTIPSATLTSSSSGTFTGQLALEYITFDIPASSANTGSIATRDVLLVLRIGVGNGAFEAPLDPARGLTVSTLPSSTAHRYVFHATRDDAEFSVDVPVTPETADDVELFHSVLVGYAADVRGDVQLQPRQPAHPPKEEEEEEDLRGRFVLMNEESGEIIGALDPSVRVHEDPSLGEKGREEDPVVVELPEDADALGELRDLDVLVRTIPPEDRDWMLKGAVFARHVFALSVFHYWLTKSTESSHVISGTTTLLTSAMATASNMYIAHSTPATSTGTQASSSSSNSSSPHPRDQPPPPPSRALLLLQSPETRKHLTRIHAVSGGAVRLSNKASATIERMIQRAGGSIDRGNGNGYGKGKSPALAVPTPQRPVSPFSLSGLVTGKPPLPPRSRSRSPAQQPSVSKPALPPRGGKSPSPRPPSSPSLLPQAQPQRSSSATPLRTRSRVALSAAIILASMAASSVRLVDAGSAAVTAAVSHKYGPVAGDNAALAGQTMRNVVLVYVDVRGLGRRAIVKRAAKTWAKGRVAKAREEAASKK